ncbi:MAG TPA: hypothetical protein VH816_15625 [Gaiellaceae bacterium]|jgi:hypothetical protein
MAATDVRNSTWLEAPELPWPLRFDFANVEEDDGQIRRILVGAEIGRPIAPGEEGDFELTMSRLAIITENFARYRQMAELLLIPTDENRKAAAGTRSAMRRRRSDKLTDDYLVGLVAEWRERRDSKNAMYDLAQSRNRHRVTIRKQLEEAERRGFVPEGLPHRAA